MDEPRLMIDRLLQERLSPNCQYHSYDKTGLLNPRGIYKICGNKYKQMNIHKKKEDIPMPFNHPIKSSDLIPNIFTNSS